MRPYVLGENAYVVLDGDLDMSRRAELLAALPDAKMVKHVVINLVRVTFIDSFILGSLVQFRSNFVAATGKPENFMIVLARGGVLERTFELTGLNKLFTVASMEPAEQLQDVSGTT